MNKRKPEKGQPTVYIVSWYGIDNTGGMERVVGLQKRVIEKKYRVVILDKDYIRNHSVLKHLYFSNHPVCLMVLFSLCVKLVKRRGDLLIGNGFNVPFVTKDISIAHGTMYAVKKALGQPVWSGSTPFERIALRNSRLIISVSEEAKRIMVSHYGIKKNKIVVINNCVNTDIFYPIEKEHTETLTILFCGRLEEGKGVADLYRLAVLISKKNNLHLKIATTDQNNIEMFSKLRNTEVCYNLKLEEMNAFYNDGDVLYLPSKCEGFEMVTLESLSAGVPVVGNRVGAIQELAEQRFMGAYLLEDMDAENTLQQLRRVALEFKGNMEKRLDLHKRVREKLGLENYAEQIMTEIDKSFRR